MHAHPRIKAYVYQTNPNRYEMKVVSKTLDLFWVNVSIIYNYPV